MLPREDYEMLRSEAAVVSLVHRQQLYDTDGPIDYVYFPYDSVVSILAGAGENEGKVEVAAIGNDGAAGVFAVLKKKRSIGANIVQIAGEALRIGVDPFLNYCRVTSRIDNLIHLYLQALIQQIVQVGVCNRLHTMEQRCARWLLMMHDRSGRDNFFFTQDFIAEIFGVRRATLNLAMSAFKAAGYIRYSRGQVAILNRAGLESIACPCYQLIRRENESVTLS